MPKMTMTIVGATSLEWSENPFLYWGVGAYLATYISYCACVFVFEFLIYLKIFPCISYAGQKDRATETNRLRKKFGFWEQFFSASFLLAGPAGLLNCVLLTYIMVFVNGGAKPDESALSKVCLQLLSLKVLDDFFLYWGHRIQHESEFLWRFHRIHHQVTTPSPVSAVYIDSLDATIQGGLPMIFAAAIITPSPRILYTFCALRVGENVLNHSGFDSTVVDLLSLKALPFRAGIGHHDAHHKFSNYAKNAKNYGEALWIWDWMFGTLSNTKRLTTTMKKEK